MKNFRRVNAFINTWNNEFISKANEEFIRTSTRQITSLLAHRRTNFRLLFRFWIQSITAHCINYEKHCFPVLLNVVDSGFSETPRQQNYTFVMKLGLMLLNWLKMYLNQLDQRITKLSWVYLFFTYLKYKIVADKQTESRKICKHWKSCPGSQYCHIKRRYDGGWCGSSGWGKSRRILEEERNSIDL